MTITDIVGSVVTAAKAKIDATEAKAAAYVEQIRDAHNKVVSAERSGHRQSLDCAIAAGELLLAAKEAVKGLGRWSDWRNEYLRDIPQTSASLYMRLAKGKDRLRSAELATGVAKLAATGELSIRKAATLLADKKPRGSPTKSKAKADANIEWLKALDVDETVTALREAHDAEWLTRLAAALRPSAGERRM
jgi:hypothetical protein